MVDAIEQYQKDLFIKHRCLKIQLDCLKLSLREIANKVYAVERSLEDLNLSIKVRE